MKFNEQKKMDLNTRKMTNDPPPYQVEFWLIIIDKPRDRTTGINKTDMEANL